MHKYFINLITLLCISISLYPQPPHNICIIGNHQPTQPSHQQRLAQSMYQSTQQMFDSMQASTLAYIHSQEYREQLRIKQQKLE